MGVYRALGVMPVVIFISNLLIIRYLIKFKEQNGDFKPNQCCVFGGGRSSLILAVGFLTIYEK
jgi:hypothetical protein